MNIVLETTSEERALWLANAIHDTSFVARVCRDFAKVHDRAEGLAKEVERLKAEHLVHSLNQSARIDGWKDCVREQSRRAEAAEAKLAVYEAPRIGTDGPTLYEQSVEIDRLTAEVSALSAAHAECKGENTKLRGALSFYRDQWVSKQAFKHMPGLEWKPTEALLDDCGNIASAALAHASEEATNG